MCWSINELTLILNILDKTGQWINFYNPKKRLYMKTYNTYNIRFLFFISYSSINKHLWNSQQKLPISKTQIYICYKYFIECK